MASSPAAPVVDKARWPVLSPYLDELLDQEPAERAARLATLRAQDPRLADELQALLASLQSLDEEAFLQAPAMPAADACLQGQAVGPYVIEHELGQGGMGSVWLAHRADGRFDGQVAIKFLHASLAPRADAERFAREGRILARLAHPHIARLLDAGVHAPPGQIGVGQPYLVLEYVDGVPIDRYCDEHRLDMPQRLALFLDVLSAVAHAHQRLILHRDIKPSNILVTRDGQVKLLDFGIAKLMRRAQGGTTTGAPATELTRRAGRAFTVAYAAPEQLQDGEVTTATDVYALGVLLYVLLGGRHPTGEATATAVDQMRATLEQVPRRLSDAVRRGGGPQAARLARALQGDLDTIVAKALKKSPAERYPHAEALGDDLRRYLDHEPIQARRDTAAYVAAKFVRRHRVGVAAAASVVVALGAGLGVALHEADEAQRQREQAEGLIEFMLGDLRQRLQPVGRLDALDAVGERALAYYAAQDLAQLDADSLGRRARALHLMGEIADDRGDLAQAGHMFNEAADTTAALVQRAPGNGQRLFDHAQSLYWVGYLARRRGLADEAERAFDGYRGLADRLVALDPSRLDWRIEQAHAHQNLGILALERSRPAEALDAFQRARDIFASASTARRDLRFEWANSLGWAAKAKEARGDLAGALAFQREKQTVLAHAGAAGDRHSERLIAHALHEQARLQVAMGQGAQGLEAARQASTRIDALVALDDSNLAWQAQANLSRLALAEAEWAVGDRDAARARLGQAASDVERLLGRAVDRPAWRLVQRGALLRLQAALQPPQPALQEALQAYVADADALAQAGRAFDAEQTLAIAAAEVLLAEHLAPGQAAQAAARRERAAQRLLQASTQGDPAAMLWRARALWALGRRPAAQELITRLQHEGYRHPDMADLQKTAASPSGAGERPST
ncbi:protein kinase [Ideonella sp.]|uniref:serine/threonine-protein kinase n=1 Tax=Ideonella sp. TaxID=1929293 RepID=UPI0035B18180